MMVVMLNLIGFSWAIVDFLVVVFLYYWFYYFELI